MSRRYSLRAPTFGSMAMLLSFRITSRFELSEPPLFSPSNANPAVIEPSPIIATVCLSSSLISEPMAMPSAADIEVELCPVPKASYSLSLRFGKPLMPLYFLFV